MLTTRIMLTALAATTLVATSVVADEKAAGPADVIQRAPGTDATAEFKLDTSKLGAVPKPELPKTRMSPKAFEQASIVSALGGGTDQAEAPKKLSQSRVLTKTKEWLIERDPLGGSLLVARRASALAALQAPAETTDPKKEGAPTTAPLQRQIKIDAAKANSLSIDRLSKFGVPADEQGQVVTKELVTQDLDGDAKQPTPVQLMAYKTFVFRAVNGVPVQGHRAVITHTPGGELKRAIVRWPAIAAQGNKLTTKLTVPQVTERAAAALQREKFAKGTPAQLRWKYVPEKQPNGEVKLKLVAAVRVQAPKLEAGEGPERFAEPREIEVPVDAE